MVACAPVPNAWPGSITTSSAVSPAGSHGGRTVSRPAEHERAVERAPALGPVVGDLGGRERDQRAPGRRLEGGQLRQLAGRAVDGVLDHVVTDLGLLHPAGRQLEQLGEHDLGVLARDPDGEAEHDGSAAEGAAQLAEHASSVRRFSSVRLAEPLEQLALVALEPARDRRR